MLADIVVAHYADGNVVLTGWGFAIIFWIYISIIVFGGD